jgi:hypothetical protein
VIDPSGHIRIPVISKLEVFDNAENISFISGGGAMQRFLYATMKGSHSFLLYLQSLKLKPQIFVLLLYCPNFSRKE